MTMICYMFNGEEIIEKPHDNRKKSEFYSRTRPSLLDEGEWASRVTLLHVISFKKI